MKYITNSQTPVYRIGANGFFSFVRSLPMGTELQFAKTEIDKLSNREFGILPSGEVMYIDALSQYLDEVEVKAKRLYDWLIWIGVAIVVNKGVDKKYKK